MTHFPLREPEQLEYLVCARCGRRRPCTTINVEALIHHHAGKLECIERQGCERAWRKKLRSALRRARR